MAAGFEAGEGKRELVSGPRHAMRFTLALTVPEDRDAVMAFPLFDELPLTIVLDILLAGVASACEVLPRGTVDVAVDDTSVFIMRWGTVCRPYEAMSDSSRTRGTTPL